MDLILIEKLGSVWRTEEQLSVCSSKELDTGFCSHLISLKAYAEAGTRLNQIKDKFPLDCSSMLEGGVLGAVGGWTDLSLMLLAVCRKRAWSVSFSVWSAWTMSAEDLSMHCLQLEICWASLRSLCAWRGEKNTTENEEKINLFKV